MRIARIMTRLNLGGPARQALASDPELSRRGHELRLFTGAPQEGEGDLFEEAQRSGIDVVRVPGLGRDPKPGADLSALRSLRASLSSYSPDVLHTHATKAGLLGRLASRGRPWPLVHTFHGHVLEGYFSKPVSSALTWSERMLAASTSKILAVSERTREDLLRLKVAPAHKLAVVTPGVALDELLGLDLGEASAGAAFRERCGCVEGDVLVVVVGRLASVKRPLVALEAFCGAASREPRLRLAFVGDGAERTALEASLAELPSALRARVTLQGGMASMLPVFAGADLVLLSSRSEGMPVALIEAAAAAVPVVATPVGGVPELVVHGETGRLAEDAAGLGLSLFELARHEHLRRSMGLAARARVRVRHSGAALADRLEGVYSSVREELQCAS